MTPKNRIRRIAILDDYQNVARDLADWKRLPSDVVVDVFHDHIRDEDRLAERLEPYDVISIMRERTPFPRSLIERLPHLRLIATTGWRNRAIDMKACKERGIVVCGTDSGHTLTAELALGLMLSLFRGITWEDRVIRNGGWQQCLGRQVAGKTLGIIGLGRLGAKVAALGKAFDMEVIAWSQNLTAERAAEHGVTRVEKDELLSRADAVTLHLVLSERTRGIMAARDFELMKPTAFIINTARGPLIDEAALVEALERKRIAGAGLDTYAMEPLPAEHPLRKLDNTVLTPHIGYVTRENYEGFYTQVLENILAWMDGKVLRPLEAQ